MKEITTYQLFCKLRGQTFIAPIGSTHTDIYRLNAQIETQELVDYLIDDITDVAQTKGNEYSVEKARNEAIKWLKEKRDYIDEIIKESN